MFMGFMWFFFLKFIFIVDSFSIRKHAPGIFCFSRWWKGRKCVSESGGISVRSVASVIEQSENGFAELSMAIKICLLNEVQKYKEV